MEAVSVSISYLGADMFKQRLTTKFAITFAVLASLFLYTAAAMGQGQPTLKVGDKAPPLGKGEWVKGEPVTSFEEGKVYVIENWATWCGPCITAIPHVTEIQHKYADKGLIIIGQNVWENNTAAVKPFVDKMGDKMDYRVVMDDNDHMANNWLGAAGQNGIPCAFVIDQKGMIAWIGHPMSMEPIVERVLAGNFDPKAEADKDAKIEELGQKLNAAAQSGDTDAAVKAANEMAKVRPELVGRLMMIKFQLLGQADRWDDAYAQANSAIDTIEDSMPLNELAWMIVAPDSQLPNKNLDVAMKAAEKANTLTKGEDAAILDTLARAYFAKGDKAKAIELQKKAIQHADDEMKAELEAALAEYQR